MEIIADRWIKSGLIWLLLAMCYGMYLGVKAQFALKSSHAHAALLGGVWSILFAWLYSRQMSDAHSKAAVIKWALFNLGVIVQVFALYMVVTAGGIWGMLIGIAGVIIIISTLWIVHDLWPRNR